MRLLILSRYDRLGSSSRLRIFQYLPYLQANGFELTIAPLFGDDYVTGLYTGKISVWKVLRSYLSRLLWLLRARNYDLVWVEKEFLPWLPSWFELRLLPSGLPWVVDYDDAVFHRYDRHRLYLVRRMLGKKIDKIMEHANLVLVGNDYLRQRAIQAGATRVEQFPTVVDTSRYLVASEEHEHVVTIGWIGSPATAKFLHIIAPALFEVVSNRPVRIVAVGANADQVEDLPIEVRKWTEATEVAEIQQFDIGIMPLPDEAFERGKCGYKLIQCMACGKAVVASPVGVNAVIVRDGIDGILARTASEWAIALTKLIDEVGLRKQMGFSGRTRVEQSYSLKIAAPRLADQLKSCVG